MLALNASFAEPGWEHGSTDSQSESFVSSLVSTTVQSHAFSTAFGRLIDLGTEGHLKKRAKQAENEKHSCRRDLTRMFRNRQSRFSPGGWLQNSSCFRSGIHDAKADHSKIAYIASDHGEVVLESSSREQAIHNGQGHSFALRQSHEPPPNDPQPLDQPAGRGQRSGTVNRLPTTFRARCAFFSGEEPPLPAGFHRASSR
jgi:hypothetical protein